MPCRSLVRILNPDDRYCMAHAVMVGLLDRQCRQQGRSRLRFQQMCVEQREEQGQLALELLQAARCRLDRHHYGLQDVARVQQLFDARLGIRAIRLVVFDQCAAYQVIWKGANRAHFNLCLVFNGDHYNYVAQPEQLMKVIFSLSLSLS